MIFDLLFLLFAAIALVSGYRSGLLKTLLGGILFIAGGIAALYFAIERNQSGWLILAIFIGAYSGAFLGTVIAKSLRTTIMRGPLRWIDSLAGATLEVGKTLLFFYLIGTILLWTPWATGQNQISGSRIYLEVSNRAPSIIAELRGEVERALEANLRP
jgi:hypothetical protein